MRWRSAFPPAAPCLSGASASDELGTLGRLLRILVQNQLRKEAAILTLQTRKRLGTAALCVGGAALLLHPACLIAFGAGAWAGSRGRDWLKRIWDDREAVL